VQYTTIIRQISMGTCNR